jgi:hypothetical protein
MNLLKCIYIHTRNQLLLAFYRVRLIQSHLRQSTSATNGSPLAQPSYGMSMHAFVSPSQPPPLGTRQVLDAAEPSEHHLRQSGYIADRPAYFVGPSDPTQACTQIARVTPCMAGSSGYNPGQFGPIMDRPVPYAGPSGYGMNRPAYYAGPSKSRHI